MRAARIADILSGRHAVGGEVRIQGWVRTRRDSKAGSSFVHVSDGSGFDPLQVVADRTLDNYEEDVLRLTSGCALDVRGVIQESMGKGQAVELKATALAVVGWVDDPDSYPMQPKRHTMEFLREQAHLRPRTNITGAVTRVRHSLAQAIHRASHQEKASTGYIHRSSPPVIAKAPASCFGSPPWIWSICHEARAAPWISVRIFLAKRPS